MMKRKIAALIIGMILMLGTVGCTTAQKDKASTASDAAAASSGTTAASDTAAASDTQAAVDSETAITEEEAKEIALTHAGLAEADVTFIKSGLEIDDGRKLYEVEFYSGNTEYDYDVDAASGEILSFDSDIENYEVGAGSQNDGEDIGEAKAKEIALAKVPGAAETNIRMQKEYDDGILKYEGTIVYEEMEYEFEIKALDGTILEWSSESVYDD